eukprot:6190124-Karenia_brevis.AAC.1
MSDAELEACASFPEFEEKESKKRKFAGQDDPTVKTYEVDHLQAFSEAGVEYPPDLSLLPQERQEFMHRFPR